MQVLRNVAECAVICKSDSLSLQADGKTNETVRADGFTITNEFANVKMTELNTLMNTLLVVMYCSHLNHVAPPPQ